MLKIHRDGTVSDSADIPALDDGQGPHEHPGTGEEMHGTEAPADGTPVTIASDADGEPGEEVEQLPPGESAVAAGPAATVAQAPDAAPEPAPAPVPHVPVAPPRRTPPRAVPGE